MTENGSLDGPRGEANEVGSKSEKRSGQQILIGKVELAEDKTGRSAIGAWLAVTLLFAECSPL